MKMRFCTVLFVILWASIETMLPVALAQDGSPAPNAAKLPEQRMVLADKIAAELARSGQSKGTVSEQAKRSSSNNLKQLSIGLHQQHIESFASDLIAFLTKARGSANGKKVNEGDIRQFCDSSTGNNKAICGMLASPGKPAEAVLIGLLLPAVQK